MPESFASKLVELVENEQISWELLARELMAYSGNHTCQEFHDHLIRSYQIENYSV